MFAFFLLFTVSFQTQQQQQYIDSTSSFSLIRFNIIFVSRCDRYENNSSEILAQRLNERNIKQFLVTEMHAIRFDVHNKYDALEPEWQ